MKRTHKAIIVVCDRGGSAYGVHPTTGDCLWRFTTKYNNISLQPTSKNGTVLIYDDVIAYGVDATTGKLLWQKDIDNIVGALQPSTPTDHFYLYHESEAHLNGSIISLEASTGNSKWESSIRSTKSPPKESILPSSTLVFPLKDSVFALDTYNGAIIWKADLNKGPSELTSSCINKLPHQRCLTTTESVYILRQAGVSSFEVDTGQTKWFHKPSDYHGVGVTREPISVCYSHDSVLYIHYGDGTLEALDIKEGPSTSWTTDHSSNVHFTIHGDSLFVVNNSGSIIVYNRHTGELLSKSGPHALQSGSFALYRGRIYICSPSGLRARSLNTFLPIWSVRSNSQFRFSPQAELQHTHDPIVIKLSNI